MLKYVFVATLLLGIAVPVFAQVPVARRIGIEAMVADTQALLAAQVGKDALEQLGVGATGRIERLDAASNGRGAYLIRSTSTLASCFVLVQPWNSAPKEQPAMRAESPSCAAANR